MGWDCHCSHYLGKQVRHHLERAKHEPAPRIVPGPEELASRPGTSSPAAPVPSPMAAGGAPLSTPLLSSPSWLAIRRRRRPFDGGEKNDPAANLLLLHTPGPISEEDAIATIPTLTPRSAGRAGTNAGKGTEVAGGWERSLRSSPFFLSARPQTANEVIDGSRRQPQAALFRPKGLFCKGLEERRRGEQSAKETSRSSSSSFPGGANKV